MGSQRVPIYIFEQTFLVYFCVGLWLACLGQTPIQMSSSVLDVLVLSEDEGLAQPRVAPSPSRPFQQLADVAELSEGENEKQAIISARKRKRGEANIISYADARACVRRVLDRPCRCARRRSDKRSCFRALRPHMEELVQLHLRLRKLQKSDSNREVAWHQGGGHRNHFAARIPVSVLATCCCHLGHETHEAERDGE